MSRMKFAEMLLATLIECLLQSYEFTAHNFMGCLIFDMYALETHINMRVNIIQMRIFNTFRCLAFSRRGFFNVACRRNRLWCVCTILWCYQVSTATHWSHFYSLCSILTNGSLLTTALYNIQVYFFNYKKILKTLCHSWQNGNVCIILWSLYARLDSILKRWKEKVHLISSSALLPL